MADVANPSFARTNLDHRLLNREVDKLIKLPKSVFVNQFTEDSAKAFTAQLIEAEDSGQSIIPVYIDSYGGQVYALLHMIDAIKACKLPVATIAIGKAMSCGAFLLSQGTEGHRYMAPYTRLMIHEVSSISWGKVEELKADVAETELLNKMAFKLLGNSTGHDDEYFLKIIHDKSHADWYLNADEAKYHNLINHIRIPHFNISVNVDVSFS